MSDEPIIKKDMTPSWRLKAWFPDINFVMHEQLKKYFTELLRFNKTINLISSKSEFYSDAIHFADSILASRAVSKNINKNEPLYDLGSGNGFPGLVYAILYPDQSVILLDSDERKCEFLKHIINTIGLKNANVSNIKVEQLGVDSIDQAICRGFSPLPKALLTLRKIVKLRGTIYHLKSEEWATEVSQIPIQLCSIWQPQLLADYILPVGDKIKMYIVKTDKVE